MLETDLRIKTVKENELLDLPISQNEKVIIFGAGDLGTKMILPLLVKNNITPVAFWDNDKNKQDKIVDGVKVLSYEEISELGLLKIIIGSNYLMQEKERINKLNYSEIIQIAIPEPLLDIGEEEIVKAIPYVEKIKRLFKDELSLKSIDYFIDYLKNRNVNVFKDVAIMDKHYLIDEVANVLRPDDTYVDLGAFIGEFPLDLYKSKIDFKKCYCFEIFEKNRLRLASNIKNFEDKVEIVPYGAYKEDAVLKFDADGANSKIVSDSGGEEIKVVTLDSYFKDKPFNYIKSDIEGAEMDALKGGVDVFKKYRPIFAFSIYHSISDYYSIPEFLNEILDNYTFLIRNHSLFCAEIVLYAIPNERFS